jgi:hypothetical protein
MSEKWVATSREKLAELARDPLYTPWIIGYLTGGFSDKQVDDVVQAALEFVEGMSNQAGATGAFYRRLKAERFH